MILAVIFDLDGIMVDSEPLQLRSFNQVLHEYGVTLTVEDFIPFVGSTQPEIFTRLKAQYAIPEAIHSLITKKKHAYAKLVEDEMQAMEGLYTLIDTLKTMKQKIGVASSSPEADIRTVLQKIGLERDFNAVVSAVGLPHGKPDPAVFLLTAKALAVKPEQCLVIEDSEVGIRAAKRASMCCIAMPNTFTNHQDFSAADFVVKDLFEVQRLISTMQHEPYLSTN